MILSRLVIIGLLGCTVLAGCDGDDSGNGSASTPDTSQGTFDQLQNDVSTLTDTNNALKAKIAELENSASANTTTTQTLINQLKTQLAGQEALTAESNQSLSEVQTALNSMRQELAGLQAQVNDTVKIETIAELNAALEALQQEFNAISVENVTAVDALKNQVRALEMRVAALKGTDEKPVLGFVHVSASGNDAADGSEAQPLATLEKAFETVKAKSSGSAAGWQVVVGSGTYYLRKPLVIDPALSGTPDKPFVIKAAAGSSPVISGAVKLDLQWTKAADSNKWTAKYAGVPFDELFVNGKRQIVARYPNSRYPEGYEADAKKAITWGSLADINKRIIKWSNPIGGFRHSMHGGHWGSYHQEIIRKDTASSVTYSTAVGNNGEYGAGPSASETFVENIKEEMDANNEWFLDKTAGEVSIILDDGTNPNTALVEGSVLKGLVEIRGSRQVPVRHVELSGLAFTQSANTFMQTTETLLRSDWKVYRGGAIYITGGENIDIGNSSLYEIGSNGIFVDGYNLKINIHDNEIRDLGFSAINFAGKEAAVRNPLTEYGHTTPLAEIDPIPGPATQGTAVEEYPRESVADNNLIYRIGLKGLQGTGVGIDIAAKIRVSHNSIYDVPRAGINIGDGTWGGHIVEGNDVFNTVRLTGDHGSFNSWGRDRFWDSGFKNAKYTPGKNYGELVKLDSLYQIVLRNNRFRCDHGWDVDLDDGSSNYLIESNLLIGVWGLKLREGYDRIARNNIILGGQGQIDPQIWPANSRDELKYNILKTAHENTNIGTGDRAVSPGSSNFNIFLSGAQLSAQKSVPTKFPQSDLNSIAADPQFVDTQNGDFTLKAGSPALALGFKNFPMVFGVQNPVLKAKAKKPGFELVNVTFTPTPPLSFGGYEMMSIAANSSESSAHAIPNDLTGASVKKVPANSVFEEGDAIVFYDNNGSQASIRDAAHVRDLLEGSTPVKFYVYRGGQLIELTVVPDVNLSLTAKATASDFVAGFGPELAIDSSTTTRWASKSLNPTITQEFPSLVKIGRIELKEQHNVAKDGFSPIQSFIIEAHTGDGNWSKIADGTTVQELSIPFSPAVSAKAMRLTMVGQQFSPSLTAFWAFEAKP